MLDRYKIYVYAMDIDAMYNKKCDNRESSPLSHFINRLFPYLYYIIINIFFTDL
jgi:hypothetical protein